MIGLFDESDRNEEVDDVLEVDRRLKSKSRIPKIEKQKVN